jgi:hypothetical protein
VDDIPLGALAGNLDFDSPASPSPDIMAQPAFRARQGERRGVFSFFAIFSVLALVLLSISVLGSNQKPRRPAAIFEELDHVDLDDVHEVKKLLTSKVRASAAGDQYLYVHFLCPYSWPKMLTTSATRTESGWARLISLDLSWR